MKRFYAALMSPEQRESCGADLGCVPGPATQGTREKYANSPATMNLAMLALLMSEQAKATMGGTSSQK